jgi:hypothetical protein
MSYLIGMIDIRIFIGKAQTPLARFVVDLVWICCTTIVGPIQFKLHSFDLLWIYCSTCCTTNPQQIEHVEFDLKCSIITCGVCSLVQHVHSTSTKRVG